MSVTLAVEILRAWRYSTLRSAPRVRGSISRRSMRKETAAVSPVSAGISRRHVPPRWCKEHLPRIGGDAPSELVALILQPEGVPGLRGCVALGTCQAGNHHVTPQQRGCVPTRAPRRGRHSRLPRECGDLPQASSSMTDRHASAPRLWG